MQRLAIICCVWAFSAALSEVAAAPANPWPTKEFVIENSAPGAWIPSGLNPFGGFTAAEQSVVDDYEKYLSEVAKYYEEMGFIPPALPTTKGRNGGVAYLVYMYKFDAGDTTAKANFLANLKVDLRIDYSRAIVKNAAVDRTYEDLAHELFHNVQRAYQTSYELDHDDWIMEGQAQALGMEAARQFRGIDVYKGKQESYWMGGRPYYRPLPLTVPDEDYRTASFWRYIAERVAAAKTNANAGAAWRIPDYSYLAKVYEHPFAGPVSESADLKWLDAGLRNATGLGLKQHYGSFAATFAAYVPTRLSAPPSTGAATAENTWLDFVYGLCPTTSLTPSSPSAPVAVALRKVASRCFKADVAGTGRVALTIHARADTISKLEALTIGTSGGLKVGSPNIVLAPVGGGYIGQWRFTIPASSPQVFVISNVDEYPARTINQDISLDLTASGWISTMTTPTPAKPPPPVPSAAPGPVASGDHRRAAARDELAADLASRTNQAASGAMAVLSHDRSPCAGESFGATLCGPLLSINLSLAPGAFGDLSQTTGAGGVLGQFMSQMTAIADHGLARTDQELKAALEEISGTEGSSVSITIPHVEYGFTGSFDNAAIIVSAGAEGGPFEAIGPEDSIPGVGREYRTSGRVTIEAFTPFVLRGRFEAGLTDGSRVEFPEGAVDVTLPIHRTISGNFVVASPWEGDSRVAVISNHSVESALRDMTQAFPALAGVDPAAIAAGKSPPSAPAVQSYPPSPVGAFPSCGCDCAPLETLEPQCRPICEVSVRECAAAEVSAATVATAQAERVALAGDVERMRSDFEDYLMANNLEGLRETMLGVFDALPTPEEKRRLLMSYGMSAAEYGDDEVQRAAANPVVTTRAEYIRGLEQQGIAQKQIDFLVGEMDAFMAENGGWPEK